MDRIRAAIGDMDAAERQLIAQRSEDWRKAGDHFFGGHLGRIRNSAGSHRIRRGIVASRDFRKEQLESWLRSARWA